MEIINFHYALTLYILLDTKKCLYEFSLFLKSFQVFYMISLSNVNITCVSADMHLMDYCCYRKLIFFIRKREDKNKIHKKNKNKIKTNQTVRQRKKNVPAQYV